MTVPCKNALPGWQFWIDRGGTFTDLVARRPDGRLLTLKLLSENPDRYGDAATHGIAALLEAYGGGRIETVKMGTTVATNALLERRGATTVLAITAGHRDALRIGTQSRPKIFALRIELPQPLHAQVIEIDERVTADGDVLRALDEAAARRDLASAFGAGFRSLAIVLMHGYRHSAHETRLAEIAAEIGYTQISVSHRVSPLIKLVARGDTTVADAYLSPVLRQYVDTVQQALPREARLLFMQSNGGLVEARGFRGKDAVLSGPAGGINGLAVTAAEAGITQAIGFDMGGTSTDVSHWAGAFERSFETVVAGVRMRAPMMSIHTIAAGGGSICRFDGARLRVGPESAGAVPGPASYRRGGPLTVTDCNVMLGKLQPAFFPTVFGPDADAPLDRAVVVARFTELASDVSAATGIAQTPVGLATGFLRIAVESMARAIRQISTQRGHDVTRYTLVSFGGAGGQHACLVAEALGMRQVMVHPFAGVLSAYGIGLADVRVLRERSIEAPLATAGEASLGTMAETLAAEAMSALMAQGLPLASTQALITARIKVAGTDSAMTAVFADADTMRQRFETAHRQAFGFEVAGKPLVIEMLVAEAIGSSIGAPISEATDTECGEPVALASVTMEGRDGVPVFDRQTLPVGWRSAGPAIIREATGTTIVEPGWTLTVDPLRNLMLARDADAATVMRASTAVDPVLLEVFNHRFMAIAERMGHALQNTATSVNIKERLDFSCALFDREARLIANAPHIPVHLGSMGDSVRAVVDGRSEKSPLRPGDVWMLNAPYNGGTHLPDITVVMPVFAADDTLLAFVAARGHHADIGGISPGSMPPNSRSVDDEGVLIDNVQLVDAGRFCEAEVRALLGAGRWPARNPDQNIADLKAQVAACHTGADELRAMIASFGREVVDAYMGHVQDNAEAAVRNVIGRLGDGCAEVEMDDGAVIRVAVRIDRAARTATVDFSGSSPQLASNFNAPRSICRAAVLYVFRTLIDDDIPLNDGCLRPIRLLIPEGSMLSPVHPAAVVAGNVETSQAITDALLAALGALAGSQGTMNNFTFGSARHQYYETICGGAGAGPGFDGASAVQTHMTNSRLTDAEVLESRFPVLVERFAIREGSGGDGLQRGGNGVIRKLVFRQPMTAGILSNRRRVPPQGLAGGGDGMVGRNTVIRADGSVITLTATDSAEMQPGDTIVIETPGGGGYGRSSGGAR